MFNHIMKVGECSQYYFIILFNEHFIHLLFFRSCGNLDPIMTRDDIEPEIADNTDDEEEPELWGREPPRTGNRPISLCRCLTSPQKNVLNNPKQMM
jgi:hypothetical protein